MGVSVSDNFECVRMVIVVFCGISEMGFALLLWTSSMEVGIVGVLVIWVVVILTQNWYMCMRLCCMVASVAVWVLGFCYCSEILHVDAYRGSCTCIVVLDYVYTCILI